MKRGEVWWHEPPDSKRRPVLILTHDEVAAQAFDVIAVPATSIARGLNTEVQIGVADGMPIECVLNVANTLSADKAFLTERITALGSSTMTEVCRASKAATGC